MARLLRIEYPGALDHIMSRGDRREAIFLDGADRHTFLRTLDEACQKTGWAVPCLVPHVVAETPQPNLVAGPYSSTPTR